MEKVTKLLPIPFETAQSLTDYHAKRPAYSCIFTKGRGKRKNTGGKRKEGKEVKKKFGPGLI